MAKRSRRKSRKTGKKAPSPAADTTVAADMPPPYSIEKDISIWWQLGLTCSVVALVFLLYANSLNGDFVFDDIRNIQDNPARQLITLTLDDLKRVGFSAPNGRRFVANISFGLNYFFHQHDTFGYRLVNIFIHLFTGLFLYQLVKTTLRLITFQNHYQNAGKIAFFTALIWLVHPLATQSVAYIVQRMNSLSALFYMLALLFYVRARLANQSFKKWLFFLGCILAGSLAIGSKENAVLLPVFILLYEWYFLQDLNSGWLKRNTPLLMGVIALLVGISLVLLGPDIFSKTFGGYSGRYFTLTERLLTQSRVVVFYLTQLVFPHPSRLNLDHDFPLSHSLIDPVTTIMAIGFIVLVIGFALKIAKRERLISFCILWYLGNLVIESSFIPLEIFFEHRTYVPSMGIILLGVLSAFRFISNSTLRLTMLSFIIAAFSLWTYERNFIWGDETKLWKDVIKKTPNSTRAYHNLGNYLSSINRHDEAIEYLTIAVKINPNYRKRNKPNELLNSLGGALLQKKKYSEAIPHLLQSLEIKPNDWKTHSNLGLAYLKQN
ncbi:MAG: tetratricopeptide repeat protein, partial [Thiotrichaceae bacterium]|nr:tetratricopeptide repeat protein [Thiotrichaceae bacterium]